MSSPSPPPTPGVGEKPRDWGPLQGKSLLRLGSGGSCTAPQSPNPCARLCECRLGFGGLLRGQAVGPPFPKKVEYFTLLF